jgi:hypothetical protein
MPIRTIDTIIDVAVDHSGQLQLPADIPVGRHRIIAIINDESASDTSPSNGAWSFPIVAGAAWPANMPVTRGEMYGDDGR